VRDYIFLAGGPMKDADMGRTKLTRDETTTRIELKDVVLPGDTLYVPPGTSFVIRDNLTFISNIATFYLMLDRLSN
jgi:hypothetical protein